MAHHSTWRAAATVGCVLMSCEGRILDRLIETAASEPAPALPPVVDRHTAIGLRRLATAEYARTVRDLLAIDATGVVLPQASSIFGLTDNQHVQQVSRGDLDAYVAAADTLSTRALPRLSMPTGCTIDGFDAGCFDRWAPTWFSRAFRRPVTPEELEQHATLFEAVRAEEGSREGLRAVLQAVRPRFSTDSKHHNPTGHSMRGRSRAG